MIWLELFAGWAKAHDDQRASETNSSRVLSEGSARENTVVNLFLLAFGPLGLWFGTGVVTSDQNGITKRFLWHSVSLRWNEITEVRLHKKDDGAIELRGNLRKLIVDSRFVAAHVS
jgi:hypothetical protein